MTSFKIAVFAIASAALAYISRASLRSVHSHGFYRFFAWEAILGLILLNIDYWVYQPFRPVQIASWSCLAVSLFLVIHGLRLLRLLGKPRRERADAPLLGLEKTTTLVAAGAYRYIRHPLYSSLLFLAWGVFFKSPSWIGGGLAVIATACLTATAKVEETENVRYFGAAYEQYMQGTKMFVPFVF